MFRKDDKLFARSSEAFLQQRELLAWHGVSAAGFRALLQRGTWWLSKPLQEVEGTIFYVESLLGGPGEAAARVFTVYPELLTCSEVNLEEKVQALQRVGVRDVTKIIIKYPKVLCDHSAQEIAVKAATLEGALGPELALAVLERRPQVVRGSTGVLCEQLAWLEKTFGQAAALRMVALEPRVTGTTVATASATYAGPVGKFEEERARRMVVVQPGLLQFKWCTFEAKVDFLTKALGHTLDEVASCASMLTVSLERRIRPRATALQAAGKAYGSLSSFLGRTDKQFEKAYGVRLRPAAAASSEAEAPQWSRKEGQPHLNSKR